MACQIIYLKMYITLLVCSFFSLSIAAVIPDEAQAETIYYENTNDGSGNYRFSFETSNGIRREESGHLENVGKEDEHIVVYGSYSYTDPDGKLVTIRYTADENGYHLDTVPSQPAFGVPANVVATLLGK